MDAAHDSGTGKIARLKHEVREKVNLLIRDNATAEQIIAYLKGEGVKGISPQNISAWKSFGFQKWLHGQQRIDEMRSRLDLARSFVKLAEEEGANPATAASDTASALVVDSVLAALEDFQPATLGAMLAEKPEKIADLGFMLASIRKGDQAKVLLQMKVDEYQRKLRQLAQVINQNGSATKEDLQQIFSEAYGV